MPDSARDGQREPLRPASLLFLNHFSITFFVLFCKATAMERQDEKFECEEIRSLSSRSAGSRDLFGLLYHTCCWFPRLSLRILARLKLPAVFICSLELQFNFECYTQNVIFAMVQNGKIVDLRPVRANLRGSKNIFFHF